MHGERRTFRWVRVAELAERSPFPPRNESPRVDVLVSSVRIHGVLAPLLVRPWGEGLQVVCGHRRLLAARAAGLEWVPALVAELDDAQAVRAFLAEKVYRRELGASERHAALEILRRLVRERPAGPEEAVGGASEPQGRAPRSSRPLGVRRSACGRGAGPVEGGPVEGGRRGAGPVEAGRREAGPVAALEASRREAVSGLLAGVERLLEGVRSARRIEFELAAEVAGRVVALPGGPLRPGEVYGGRAGEEWLPPHSLLVASWNGLAAREAPDLGDPEEAALAGLLHDAGMVFLRRPYLWEARALEPHERREVASHTRLGHALVLGGGASRLGVARAARDHHERDDGSGYPRGRTARDLSVLARLTAFADVAAAVLAPRPHRSALEVGAALEHLEAEVRRGRFSADLFCALVPLFARLARGSRRAGPVVAR